VSDGLRWGGRAAVEIRSGSAERTGVVGGGRVVSGGGGVFADRFQRGRGSAGAGEESDARGTDRRHTTELQTSSGVGAVVLYGTGAGAGACVFVVAVVGVAHAREGGTAE
jgi:hypothetical protein